MTAILIPAYNPTDELIEYVSLLNSYGFSIIVVVNDGCTEEYGHIFSVLEGAKILNHDKNRGKGAALKTGLRYITKNHPDISGIITADCDGQHSAEDVVKISNELEKNDGALLLGSRCFKDKKVPPKSRFGNNLTRGVFWLFFGKKLKDTQTGLRGLPTSRANEFITLSGNRYEYEINMLIKAVTAKIPIKEIGIQTIYIENNKGSHFNPFIDSIKIYFLILKMFLMFSVSSIGSFLVDMLFFALFTKLLKCDIWSATVFARAVSSVFNFAVNKNTVFTQKGAVKKTVLKYYALAIPQMLLSAFFVDFLCRRFLGAEMMIKMVVDTALFFVSFQIQRLWVFDKTSRGGDGS